MKAAGGVEIPDADRLRNVTLIHSCRHFSLCYPFNRFLALFVNELVGGAHFIPERRLRNLESADAAHCCAGSAARCWEFCHNATFFQNVCGSEPVEIIPRCKYHILVIRHGPRPGTPKLARQILPYNLPWFKGPIL